MEENENIWEPHHPDFSISDGSTIFRVEDMLYKLHNSTFTEISQIFKELCDIPQEMGGEGKSDANPIILHGIAKTDFDHLLQYLYRKRDDEEETLEYLVSVLRLCMLWDINMGQRYAIRRLSVRKDLKPSLRMNLARKYDIKQWIKPAFLTLVAMHIDDFEDDDVFVMGPDIYHLVQKAKHHIMLERLYISYSVPDVVISPDCTHPPECKKDWNNSWWNGFCKHLLHPEYPLSAATALAKLNAVRLPVMCRDCLIMTVERIKGSCVLEFTKRITDEILEEIMESQENTREGRIIQPARMDSDSDSDAN